MITKSIFSAFTDGEEIIHVCRDCGNRISVIAEGHILVVKRCQFCIDNNPEKDRNNDNEVELNRLAIIEVRDVLNDSLLSDGKASAEWGIDIG